ncbi:MAG TPA: glycosyltransferase [Verrucomicrobiae bacterium]|jgi:glycosyltransferase involved in cell wall biosynthesis|nr:glycosyltransferase [Verrucomicrobiae bacterium]
MNAQERPIVAVLAVSDLEFGGAQRQIVELVNNMDPAVCELHVCSLSDYVPLAKAMRLGAGRLNFVLRRFRFDFTVVPRLARLLKKVKADVVHSYLFDATIAARLASLLARRTAVIGSERNTDYKFKRSDFLALKATQRWNDLTIANSRAGANFNSRVFHEPLSRYCVVHNGVDVTRFDRRDPARIRQELGLAPDQPVIGMFASFKPQKNHPVWLAAARQVIQRVPNAKLMFVGDELYKGGSDSIEFKKSINQTVDDLGLRDHCLFLGNRLDVEDCYNACTLTVLPSLYEGTPNVVLESMACAVPIVASNVSDNAYIVRDGETGFVVPVNEEVTLADRVCRILLDPALRRRLADEARSWVVREFSCRRLAEKTVDAYRKALITN